jgi:hypothetical protein
MFEQGDKLLLYIKLFLLGQFHVEPGFCVSLLPYDCYIHKVNMGLLSPPCGAAECGVSYGQFVPELSPDMIFLLQ